ncbi:MAG TPA: hypothetical protein VFG69_18910 [Nannocystaceae bacterium]|nr:hypothetical protein [Nannocystaceae bacterium]
MHRLPGLRGTALSIAIAAALGGCEVSKHSEVCVPANDGKVVSVIGYVSVGGFSLVSSDNTFPIQLVEKMGAEENVRVSVKLGDGPNTMKPVPEGDFTNDDIEIRLADGSTKDWGDRIKVTGKLTVNGETCAMYSPDSLSAP